MNAFQVQKYTRNISTWDGCNPVTSRMTVFLTIFWQLHYYTISPRDNINLVKQALFLSQNTGATLKLKNCSSCACTTHYLYHFKQLSQLEIAIYVTNAVKGLIPSRTSPSLDLSLDLAADFFVSFPVLYAKELRWTKSWTKINRCTLKLY